MQFSKKSSNLFNQIFVTRWNKAPPWQANMLFLFRFKFSEIPFIEMEMVLFAQNHSQNRVILKTWFDFQIQHQNLPIGRYSCWFFLYFFNFWPHGSSMHTVGSVGSKIKRMQNNQQEYLPMGKFWCWIWKSNQVFKMTLPILTVILGKKHHFHFYEWNLGKSGIGKEISY